MPWLVALFEPYVGYLWAQPVFPSLHAPGTLTFFLVLGAGVPVRPARDLRLRLPLRRHPRDGGLRLPRPHRARQLGLATAPHQVVVLRLLRGRDRGHPVSRPTAWTVTFVGMFGLIVAFTYFGTFFVAPLTRQPFLLPLPLPLRRHLRPAQPRRLLRHRHGRGQVHRLPPLRAGLRHGHPGVGAGPASGPRDRARGLHGLRPLRGVLPHRCARDPRRAQSVPPEPAPERDPSAGTSRRDRRRAGMPPASARPRSALATGTKAHAARSERSPAQAARCLDCGVPGLPQRLPPGQPHPRLAGRRWRAGDIAGAAAILADEHQSPARGLRHAVPAAPAVRGADLRRRGAGWKGAVTIGAIERCARTRPLRWTGRPHPSRGNGTPRRGDRRRARGARPAPTPERAPASAVTVYDRNTRDRRPARHRRAAVQARQGPADPPHRAGWRQHGDPLRTGREVDAARFRPLLERARRRVPRHRRPALAAAAAAGTGPAGVLDALRFARRGERRSARRSGRAARAGPRRRRHRHGLRPQRPAPGSHRHRGLPRAGRGLRATPAEIGRPRARKGWNFCSAAHAGRGAGGRGGRPAYASHRQGENRDDPCDRVIIAFGQVPRAARLAGRLGVALEAARPHLRRRTAAGPPIHASTPAATTPADRTWWSPPWRPAAVRPRACSTASACARHGGGGHWIRRRRAAQGGIPVAAPSCSRSPHVRLPSFCIGRALRGALASHVWRAGPLRAVPRGHAARARSARPAAARFSRGAGLLQRYCAQCHTLPGPGHHTGEEWPEVLRRMDTSDEGRQPLRRPARAVAVPDYGRAGGAHRLP